MTLPSLLRHGAQALIQLMAPRCCALCARALGAERRLVCSACCPVEAPHSGLHTSSEGLPVWAIGSYVDPLSGAIRSLKYARRADLAAPLAEQLYAVAPQDFGAHVAVVPVPLHPFRLCERGYNQAGLLAQRLARLWGAQYQPRLLCRTVQRGRQAELGRAERLQNLSHTMRAAPRTHERSVVLIDDVLTTGATLHEARRALDEAGAHVIAACVLAIADKELERPALNRPAAAPARMRPRRRNP